MKPADTQFPSSRRAIIVGAIGALGAWAASAVGRPSVAEAHDPDDVLLGGVNHTSAMTYIGVHSLVPNDGLNVYYDGSVGADDASAAVSAGNVGGDGVIGRSATRSGVVGVFEPGSTYVMGKPKTGVFGYGAADANSIGVWGKSVVGRGVTGEAAGGIGVRALATNGTGIYATATTGVAFRATGRVRFDNCIGVATIAAGNVSTFVAPGVDLTTSTVVVLTPQADPGTRRLWATVDATANTFTIHVSSAVSGSLKVAWHAFG